MLTFITAALTTEIRSVFPTDAEIEGVIQEEVVMDDSPDWNYLTEFENDPAFVTGALYGRGAGWDLDTGCSGFLVDDDIWVDASHCGIVADDDLTITIQMGNFGGTDPGNNDPAIAEARQRLVALGIPQATVDGLGTNSFTRWVCDLDQEMVPDRDIDYYECSPNRVSWTESPSWEPRSTYVDLLPGHVWGHFNVEPGDRPDGRDLYLISHNTKCGDGSRTSLLSPGEVTDDSSTCADGGGYSWGDDCFNHNADSMAGSSGAVLVDSTTNRAFGVNHGHEVYWFGDEDDPCDSWSWAVNDATYIRNEIYDYTDEDAGGNGWPMGGWTWGTAPWIGGFGGSQKGAYCEDGMMVGGVVGSTAQGGWAGNLGFVCVPHNSKSAWRFDRAEVLAMGSWDTGFTFDVVDANTYLHEVRSDNEPGAGVQHLAMCPAGYFVDGIGAMAGQYVGKLLFLLCEDPRNGHETYRWIANGDGFIGTKASGLAYEFSGCPAGQYFAGLEANTGWHLDGFNPVCRYED